MVVKCIVRPVNNGYLPIDLRNNKPLMVGRSKETKIKLKACSRHQVQLTANFDAGHVVVEQVGPNSSGVNGNVIGMGLCKIAKDGDIIDLVVGEEELKYKVTFEGRTGGVKHENGDTSEGGGNPKAVKIPKMFLPRGSAATSAANEFAKSNSLVRGSWETFDSKKVMVYTLGESVLDPKSVLKMGESNVPVVYVVSMETPYTRVFPKNDTDWRFLYNSTVTKLQATFESNKDAKFVIFTNQAGISNGKTQIPSFKKKIETITSNIGVPVIAFILYGKNEYRKPLPNVWSFYVEKYNAGVTPDLEKSLFIGDAAGRKKDHSKADRLFALNIGLPFRTPEEFFMSQKPQDYSMPLFNPQKVLEEQKTNDHIKFPHGQECIILVGFPGSGKSSYVKSVLKPISYVHINRDEMKTAAKCKSAAETALREGLSVVIDNTNPTSKDRLEYIQMARRHGVQVRCFLVKVDHAHALHNNKFRECIKDSHSHVPEVAFNTYKSKFQEPTMAEGYDELVTVNFVPQFENDERRRFYSLYLLEK